MTDRDVSEHLEHERLGVEVVNRRQFGAGGGVVAHLLRLHGVRERRRLSEHRVALTAAGVRPLCAARTRRPRRPCIRTHATLQMDPRDQRRS